MSSVTLVWPSSTHWLGISTASPPWTEDVISVPYISGGILAFAPVAASFSLPSSRKRVQGQHRCPPFAISYFLNSQEELACSTWPVLPWWNKIHLSDKILRVNKPDVKGGATPSKKKPRSWGSIHIHSFNKYVLGAYHAPASKHRVPVLLELIFQWGMTGTKYIQR